MKIIYNTIFIVLIAFTLAFNSDNGDKMSFQEIKEIRKEFRKECSVRHDAMSETIWIGSKKGLDWNQSVSEVYFGLSEYKEVYDKRLKLTYVGSSWLFIEKVTFSIGSRRKDNMRIYELDIDEDKVNRQVISGGNINETIDIRFNDTLEKLFNDVLNSEKNEIMIIRFTGKSKYYDSAIFSNKYTKMAEPVFKAHSILVNRFKKSEPKDE